MTDRINKPMDRSNVLHRENLHYFLQTVARVAEPKARIPMHGLEMEQVAGYKRSYELQVVSQMGD